MKKTFFKKALAVLCVLMLLPLGDFYSSAQGAEETYAADLRGLTELTLLDAGISDCTNQQKDGYNSLQVETLDNTLFSMRLAYQAANGSRFHYGVNNTNSYSGISFRLEKVDEKEVLTVGNEVGSEGIANLPWALASIDPVQAGVGETFANTEFLLQISTQFVDHDGGGTKNDIKLGIFINGKLYDDRYCYIDDSADQLGTNINFNSGAAALLGSYTRDSGVEYEKWTVGEESTSSLAGSSFSAMANITSGNLWIGNGAGDGFVFAGEGGASGTGLTLYLVKNDQYPLMFSLTDEKAGCQLRNNDNLKITMTVETVGTKGTKLSIYFNDALYGGSSIYTTERPELQRNLAVDSTIALTPYYDRSLIPVPTGLTELTLLDAGISDCMNQQKNGFNSLNVESLNNTLFSIRLAYQAANGSRFHFGVNNSELCSGISFRLETSNGKEVLTVGNEVGSSGITNLPWALASIDPAIAGVGETFVNTEFLLQISTQFVDHDGGGAEDDIKLGIFINGQLYNNQYCYINNSADQLGTNINFNEGAAALLGSYTRASGAEYEKWTVGEESTSPLAGSSFSAMANITSGNLWIGNGEGDGFVFAGEGGASGTGLKLYLIENNQYLLTYLLTDEKAGCQLRNNDNLKLTMAVETVGTKGTKLSIYFNDVLYGGSPIYTTEMPKLPRRLAVASTITLTPFCEEVPVPSDLTELTLLDAGISDCVNQQKDGYNSLQVANLDNTLFSMRLAYQAANGSRFHYGVNNSHTYSGISFRLENSDGKEVLTVGNEVGSDGIANLPFALVSIDPIKAGVGETFVNTEFLLQISTQFVDHDGGGTKNDIKLGIFINGKLYNNQYCYINDSADQIGTNINFNAGAAALLGSYVKDSGVEYEKWTMGEDSDASLNGSMFLAMANITAGNLRLGDGDANGFVFAGEDGDTGNGLKLYLIENGAITFGYSLTDEKAKCQLRRNSNLKLAMAVEKVGTKGTKLSVYFNDVLYGESPIYVAKTTGFQRKTGVSSDQVTLSAIPGTIVQQYSATEYAKYRAGATYTAPILPGYVFAGWFKNESCTEVLDTDTTEETAYAKFVDTDVLTVKAQISANTKSSSPSTNIRFITTVDSLDYKKVGFDIHIAGYGDYSAEAVTVYKVLYAVGSEKVDSLSPRLFSSASEYFSPFTYFNVPNTEFDTEFTVTPYWITLDGTKVYGTKAVKTVRMGI